MKEATQMCEEKNIKDCEHPEKLHGKPEDCTPEQIRECHGDAGVHCCGAATNPSQEE